LLIFFYCFYSQIHYERAGKEGNGSCKEITVLFVPNLSECLPAIEAWRAQWLAHRKALTEREEKEEKVNYSFFKNLNTSGG
jgi:DBC1